MRKLYVALALTVACAPPVLLSNSKLVPETVDFVEVIFPKAWGTAVPGECEPERRMCIVTLREPNGRLRTFWTPVGTTATRFVPADNVKQRTIVVMQYDKDATGRPTLRASGHAVVMLRR